MEQTSLLNQTALLFEGGGMRASYTSGMVVALLEAGIHAPFVAGISAGASNTANYLSHVWPRARESFIYFASVPKFSKWRTFLRCKVFVHSDNNYYRACALGISHMIYEETIQ